MRRYALLALVVSVVPVDPPPDLGAAPTWIRLVVGGVGALGGWKVAAWLYVDFLRPRLDRFVRDSRVRSGADDDAITLGILGRNSAALDAHIVGALTREPDAVAHVIAHSLREHAIEHGAFLRREIFADDIRDNAAFRSRIEASQTTLEAVAAGLEGLSAAQLAQGRALADMPRLADMMERVGENLESVNKELRQISIGQGEMRGKLDVVERIVLGAHPPAGVPERREPGAVRRAEDLVAGQLIDGIRKHAELHAEPHAPDSEEPPR